MTLTEHPTVDVEESSSPLGRAVRRREDARFLTGSGAFLADIQPPGVKHAAILRSTAPHARIRRLDLDRARVHPGVTAVFSGADLAAASNPISHLLPMPTIKPITWHVLATDTVRFVGEPIAIVIADSRYVAEDALDLIEVDYEGLPAVTNAMAALEPDSALLYEEWGSNDFLSAESATGDLDAAFASADGTLSETIKHHRVIGLPLEGHGACASYDSATDELLIYVSSQQPHNLRTALADVTGMSEANIRVVAPDMGGGFGNKQHFLREDFLMAVVARLVPYPVSWVQDRFESLNASVHSREQIHEVDVAYRNDGRVLGLRVRLFADVGNPVLYFTGAAPALVTTSLLTGTYDIPNYAYELHCVATNKCPMGAYRGFGQPQAILTIERVMDLVAERLDLDPLEVRRQNFIPDSPRPFTSPTGARYDTGSFREQLDRVAEEFHYDDRRIEQQAARADGRYLGIGFASMVESTAPNLHVVAGRYGGFEMALVSVQPDGHVNIVVGTKSQGQGHETAFAQVAADALTIPVDHVMVSEGDTGTVPYGMGTWGSRSAVMGGGAIMKGTAELREKMTAIAANMLEVDVADVTLSDGLFHAGEATLPFAAVAGAAYLHTFLLPPGMDMGLSVVASYDPGNTSPFPDAEGKMNVASTYAAGAAAALVEVDISTGEVSILDFAMVHDCGTVINPMIVDGQIQGAFAQAVGTVLFEELVYDENGQLLTATLLDYLIPAFGSVPRARPVHVETPSPLLGGFRGAGEAAIIAAPAALVNAVHNALAPLGVAVNQTNLGRSRVRALLRDAGVEIDPVRNHRVRGQTAPSSSD